MGTLDERCDSWVKFSTNKRTKSSAGKNRYWQVVVQTTLTIKYSQGLQRFNGTMILGLMSGRLSNDVLLGLVTIKRARIFK